MEDIWSQLHLRTRRCKYARDRETGVCRVSGEHGRSPDVRAAHQRKPTWFRMTGEGPGTSYQVQEVQGVLSKPGGISAVSLCLEFYSETLETSWKVLVEKMASSNLCLKSSIPRMGNRLKEVKLKVMKLVRREAETVDQVRDKGV